MVVVTEYDSIQKAMCIIVIVVIRYERVSLHKRYFKNSYKSIYNIILVFQ